MSEMFIINCPLMFRAAYKMFKPFINEATRKKIHIRGGSYKDMFEKIDPDQVPEFLGGTCVCPGEDGCNLSDKGPWLDYPGDEFGEAQMKIVREREAIEGTEMELMYRTEE